MNADDQHQEEDAIFFADEEESPPARRELVEPWQILVADDEAAIHEVTRLSLDGLIFDGRPLLILSAHSAAEARRVLADHPDIALVLLDVVMEEDDAGLRVVRYLREELKNSHIRVVLRTGQPGQAPEREVLLNYDINDYKAKSELTSQKLFTAVITALRAYRDLKAIDANRRGLRKIIDASASLFSLQSMKQLISGVLQQLSTLLGAEGNAVFCKVETDNSGAPTGRMLVMGATGTFESAMGHYADEALSPEIQDCLRSVTSERCSRREGGAFASLFVSRGCANSVVYLEGPRPFQEGDQQLMELFCANASIAFDNIYQYEQFLTAQKLAMESLSRLAEFKEHDSDGHLRRVGERSVAVAEQLRRKQLFPDIIDGVFVQHLELASLLHDVGKVGVPDEILMKSGHLDDRERLQMQGHAVLGGAILAQASAGLRGVRSYLTMAVEIAESHHEWFDGTGYPRGLKGQQIPLAARIVALADVFDALMARRPYKGPWTEERALEQVVALSGTQFDPDVVAAFMTVVGMANRSPSVAEVGAGHLSRRGMAAAVKVAVGGERKGG